MPAYAILGATGSTGQALLDNLLKAPEYTVNAYVRSKSKLERLRPGISKTDKVNIFEGDLHDIPLITRCIADVSAVFAVVASNENIPNITVAQDTAHVIVAALCNLRTQNPAARIPKIVFLSSATLNPHFCRHQPAIAHSVLATAFSNVYGDLARAEEYLRLHKSWLNATFIQPGGLVHDAKKGHALSLTAEKTFLSYLDLAAGMIEVANAEGKYHWMGIAVVPTAKDVKIEWRVPLFLAKGLLFHFLPWMYFVFAYLRVV
ncbi:hypothetical protein MMC16_006324 [Acarospora aff. strigata]|nr:hypothetical protein [Acarospora aff. strigata]